MKILRYVSDLHLEFRYDFFGDRRLRSIWEFDIDPSDTYYLALLGDIGNPYDETLGKFISLVSKVYKNIFYVPGNHEYYNLTKEKKSYIDCKNKLSELSIKYPNLIIMDNNVFCIDGLKIIGSTLWSHISPENHFHISKNLNDYHLIYDENLEKISIETTNLWNRQALDFIKSQICDSDLPCIILTHHCPLLPNPMKDCWTASPRYLNGKYNQAFHNDLSYLMNYPIIVWLYGHTHWTSNFDFNSVKIATNQLGYKTEESEYYFNQNAAINLDRITIDSQ